jgi:hypothetical protein
MQKKTVVVAGQRAGVTELSSDQIEAVAGGYPQVLGPALAMRAVHTLAWGYVLSKL